MFDSNSNALVLSVRKRKAVCEASRIVGESKGEIIIFGTKMQNMNPKQYHSVSIVEKTLPKELTITLKLDKGKKVAYLVA